MYVLESSTRAETFFTRFIGDLQVYGVSFASSRRISEAENSLNVRNYRNIKMSIGTLEHLSGSDEEKILEKFAY